MKLALVLLCVAAPLPAVAGSIQGTVVNTSTGTPLPCQVSVVLQVQVKGQFVPFRDTISDTQGRYRFARLPVDDAVVYQPAASRGGVVYPGPRIRLTERQPGAVANLSVCDAVASPSPLVLKKMDVTIRPETGILKVTESLLIENPSHTCYVGLVAQEGTVPVTLELSIPPDFQRTTFDLEFFGRRFVAVNDKVVTSVPWPPGERKLRYTYVLRNTQKVSQWKRPLDLPCSNVTIRVEGMPPDEVRCRSLRQTSAGNNAVVFESAGQELPAGQVLKVDLGRLPLPWMTYGKWAALAIMLGLIAAASWLHFRRRRQPLPVSAVSKPQTAGNTRKRAA